MRRFLPAVAAAVTVTGALALLAGSLGKPSKAVAERIPPANFFVGETPEGDIWLRGRVSGGMYRQFERIRGKEGGRVILTSSGGSARDGMAIAELIAARRMHTVVRGACYSSCANYLFFAGVTKTVEPGGLLGFHGWPRAATDADRQRIAAAIRRRSPAATEAEIDASFALFRAQSAEDMARQARFYASVGAPRLPHLMRVLLADPVDYPTGRPYRGGRLAIVPTRAVLERCFGVKGLVGYDRPSRVVPIDWASPRAPQSPAELQLVWTRDPDPDCAVFDRAGSDARPRIERTPTPAPEQPQRRRRIRVITAAF